MGAGQTRQTGGGFDRPTRLPRSLTPPCPLVSTSVFTKSKKKGERKLGFAEFQDALEMISVRKFPHEEPNAAIGRLLAEHVLLNPASRVSGRVHSPAASLAAPPPAPHAAAGGASGGAPQDASSRIGSSPAAPPPPPSTAAGVAPPSTVDETQQVRDPSIPARPSKSRAPRSAPRTVSEVPLAPARQRLSQGPATHARSHLPTGNRDRLFLLLLIRRKRGRIRPRPHQRELREILSRDAGSPE